MSTEQRRDEVIPPPYEPHVGETRQYVRDIILGVNDGLVSTFLLIVGVVGGGLDTRQILLTGVAGAIAGAISMGTGEWLATRSQEEVFDREISLEKTHIRHYRDMEVEQLREFFADVGIEEDRLEDVVEAFAATDTTLLNAMKVFEFGIVDSERRSPMMAMLASGGLFLMGALTSVVPFFFAGSPGVGLAWAGGLTAIALFGVGVAKTTVTGTNPIPSGLQNLLITVGGGIAAFLVGRLFNASVG